MSRTFRKIPPQISNNNHQSAWIFLEYMWRDNSLRLIHLTQKQRNLFKKLPRNTFEERHLLLQKMHKEWELKWLRGQFHKAGDVFRSQKLKRRSDRKNSSKEIAEGLFLYLEEQEEIKSEKAVEEISNLLIIECIKDIIREEEILEYRKYAYDENTIDEGYGIDESMESY